MRISYAYDIGDIVTVQPYSIFSNPTPIEWNKDPYGYGEEWKPGQTFTYEKQVDFYAQYNPININYHLTGTTSDGTLTAYVVSYANRFGTRLEVAEFPGIDNFKCWLDCDGNIVSAGSYVQLTSTYDLFMSCSIDYTLSFNAAGGKGSMQPITSTHSIYVDRHTRKIAQTLATVELPIPQFQAPELECIAWNINEQTYDFNTQYTLAQNTTAYAVWVKQISYILDLDCCLMNSDYTFRYFMLKIDETLGGYTGGRFSKLCFVNSSTHEQLEFPKQATCKMHNISPMNAEFQLTQPLNALDGQTTTNVAFNGTRMPCGLEYDLKQRVIDISKYDIFQIWTAYDSNSHVDQNFKTFQLYFSNNDINWYLADTYSGSVNTNNASIMYQSNKIFVDTEETHIDFSFQPDLDQPDEPAEPDEPDTPDTPDQPDQPVITDKYTIKTYAIGNGGYINTGYIPTFNTKLKFEMRTNGSYTGSVYFGIDSSIATDEKDFRCFCTSAAMMFWDTAGYRFYYDKKQLDASTWYRIECSKDGMTVDGDSATFYKNISDTVVVASLPIQLFGFENKTVNVGLKYFEIYESDVLKMRLLPAADENNRSCLVDTLTNRLYYSSNSKDIYCANTY